MEDLVLIHLLMQNLFVQQHLYCPSPDGMAALLFSTSCSKLQHTTLILLLVWLQYFAVCVPQMDVLQIWSGISHAP